MWAPAYGRIYHAITSHATCGMELPGEVGELRARRRRLEGAKVLVAARRRAEAVRHPRPVVVVEEGAALDGPIRRPLDLEEAAVVVGMLEGLDKLAAGVGGRDP